MVGLDLIPGLLVNMKVSGTDIDVIEAAAEVADVMQSADSRT